MANGQQFNMNSYVGLNSSTWDPNNAVILQGAFGHLVVDQGGNKVDSQHGLPKVWTPQR